MEMLTVAADDEFVQWQNMTPGEEIETIEIFLLTYEGDYSVPVNPATCVEQAVRDALQISPFVKCEISVHGDDVSEGSFVDQGLYEGSRLTVRIADDSTRASPLTGHSGVLLNAVMPPRRGLLATIHDVVKTAKALNTDQAEGVGLCDSLQSTIKAHRASGMPCPFDKFITFKRHQRSMFCLQHPLVDVWYDTTAWGSMTQEMSLKESQLAFINNSTQGQWALSTLPLESGVNISIAAELASEGQRLLDEIQKTNCHYVMHLKSNLHFQKATFDSEFVCSELPRCAGALASALLLYKERRIMEQELDEDIDRVMNALIDAQ